MLETPNLTLRPHRILDAPHLFDLNSDPEVMRYTGDSSFANPLEALRLIQDKMVPVFEKYRMGRFAVFLKDGTYIGWCGLKPFPEQNEVDLGYRFKKIRKN